MKDVGTTRHILAVFVVLTTILAMPGVLSAHQPGFTDSFMFDECGGFSYGGSNPFFILKPGYQQVFEGKEEGEDVRLTITVLKDTKTIEGIRTRIVEERETHDGELVEVSRNFFAICNRNNSVFYFGEKVDLYENGEIVSHEGSWEAGTNGASPGLVMPGVVLLGARYVQEIAPKVAMDRAEIVSINEVVETSAGEFENCLKTKETTPLEPGVTEFKFYAPGVGLVQDGVLKLVESGFI